MLKIAKSMGIMILYLVIYAFMQFIVGAIFGVVYAVIATMKVGTENQGEFQDYITTNLMENAGYILIVAAILTFLIYWVIDRKKNIRDAWQIHSIPWRKAPLLLLLGMSTGLSLSYVLHLISQLKSLKPTFENYETFSNDLLSGNFLLLLLSVGILIPIFEEVLFRGIILNKLRKTFSLRVAFIIQAVVFGLYHMNLVQSTYAIVLGLLLGYISLKFNSIIAPIGVHIGVNTLAVLTTLESIANIMDDYGLLFLIGGMILFIITMFWAFKYRGAIRWKEEQSEETLTI